MNNLIKIMSARKEFGGVITFIVHPDFIRDGRFYPVIPKTIQKAVSYTHLTLPTIYSV